MKNNPLGKHYQNNLEPIAGHGNARRTNLGSVPCGVRIDGSYRESGRLDLFDISDEATKRRYTYACIEGVELRFSEHQSNVLATILG